MPTSTYEGRNGLAGTERRPASGSSSQRVAPLPVAPAARPSPLRRLRRWFTPRVLGGLVVMAMTFAGYLAWLLLSTPSTSDVLVLARDVPAGAALGRADLIEQPMQLPDAQAQLAVTGDAIDRVVGRRLVGPAFRDQLLVWPELESAGQPELEPGHEAVTVAVRPDTAASGALRKDDVVRLVVTTNKGRPDASSRTVIGSARVLVIGRGDQRAATTPSSGPVSLGGDAGTSASSATGLNGTRQAQPISTVTLSVSSDQVEALTAAKWAGEIDLVLLANAAPPAAGTASQ
ncbi:MAG: Flp pilus assembly protein CpaB [Chloroflexota bacterium]|nr:Flp pilus assembly protein CpaB [Chloroflexota bacterium]